MGVAAVVHLHVFPWLIPAKPYVRGERCVRNVAVLDDYAALGTPPDPDEVQDSARSTRVHLAQHDAREKRLNFPVSVMWSWEVEKLCFHVERGIPKINKTFHQISENVKQHEARRRKSKDDSSFIPLNSWSEEFTETRDCLVEGSASDSGLASAKRHYNPSISPIFEIRDRDNSRGHPS
ncbi:hypothetical protein IFM89_027182 [Coptis chinensis]|uniref:Uncharacterized protein n=1 Tax=Coptis chinensis TaxID=261450 RepID=A0A835MG31_9MAGN|nr:hypothetical protein IFM89_027182 [Coptis chinensis]